MILPLSIVLRICLATALGAIVGIERERSERAAGLRTHAMVALGAAVFMLTSAFGFKDVLGAPAVVLDPSRVAAQIVTGIGFLGAGAIIFQNEVVRGLTTAASIWVVAAIGMAAAGGMYLLAVSTTALTLIVLAVLKKAENRWFKDRRAAVLSLKIDPNAISLLQIRSEVETQGIKVEQIKVTPDHPGSSDRVGLMLSRGSTKNLVALIERLSHLAGVAEVSSGSTEPTREQQGVK